MPKFRITVKEVWLDAFNKHMDSHWVETFNTRRSAQRRVKQIRETERWDCVGDWKLEVDGDIEQVGA